MTRIDDLIAALTVDEKVALTAGVDMWHTASVDRLGIKALRMTDGPVGARGTRHTGGPPSACFPCGTALAATWDVELVERVGAELGKETKAKGAHLLLAPTVNLHRTPLAGRNFECYSEDPYLTARMAVAYIGGVQSQGVGACIKHFVANDQEFERLTISVDVPDDALRRLYLRPFEVAISEARPVAVMGAYNKVAGTWCCEHPRLLTTILRDEWGYDGLVVSDWYATHSTAEALNAGLDIEMPGPTLHRGDALRKAVESGEVAETTLDASVRRVLVAMERTGALDDGPGPEGADDEPERRAVAREAARSAVVLLRNDPVGATPVLPLPDDLASIAVIGPNADAVNILGGGSAAVTPYHATTILDGLRARYPAARIVHEPGCRITPYPGPLDVRLVDGLVATFDDAPPVPLRRAALSWSPTDVPARATMHGRFTAPAEGVHVFQLVGSGRTRLLVDGEVVVDGWGDDQPRRVEGSVRLDAGQEAELVVEVEDGGSGRGIELRCQVPLPDDALERAVAAAAAADVAIVVVGTNGDWETEGRDRKTLDLPGRQAELATAVAAADPRTAVVVNAGSPVTLDGLDAPALLQSWFLGQETGDAVADVLSGDVDASGRLPTTIPRRIEDTPAFGNYPGVEGVVRYEEGVLIGYRWYDATGIEPAFRFGHGLSYTTFEHGPQQVGDGVATVEVTNTGGRAGVETVQVYVDGELAGFAKVRLDPGESRHVEVRLR